MSNVKNFYKEFNLLRISNKSEVLKNQELYNIYRVPKKRQRGSNTTHIFIRYTTWQRLSM